MNDRDRCKHARTGKRSGQVKGQDNYREVRTGASRYVRTGASRYVTTGANRSGQVHRTNHHVSTEVTDLYACTPVVALIKTTLYKLLFFFLYNVHNIWILGSRNTLKLLQLPDRQLKRLLPNLQCEAANQPTNQPNIVHTIKAPS